MEKGKVTVMGDILSEIHERFDTKGADIRTYSPLTLAYIGDAVYEIIIRTLIVERGQRSVEALHKQTTRLVCAQAQSKLVMAVYERLSGEEQDIYRRGKNTKLHSTAKNAALADYKRATGLEALCGFLFLEGKTQRLVQIVSEALELAGVDLYEI
ncbi:MAG: ribonuclease III [Lachnospiraceae bacterium]|nr:ribonuclease III [Lachnospiraceae bacterium]